MLHYFKFRQDLLDPVPARDVYLKRARGKGWPEECPPIRAANAFGFDVLANFTVTFSPVSAQPHTPAGVPCCKTMLSEMMAGSLMSANAGVASKARRSGV